MSPAEEEAMHARLDRIEECIDRIESMEECIDRIESMLRQMLADLRARREAVES